MSPLQVVLIVVEAAAASVVLPPMAWLLARTWRNSAASRRLVWITALAMLLALPLLAGVAPGLAVIALPAPAPVTAGTPIAVPVAAESATAGLTWFDLIPLAAAVWLAGVAKLAAQHLVALVRLELMRRRAAGWPRPAPIPVRGCDLLVSEDCPGPMTWGVLRPVIMLPDAALDWSPDRLAAVLRHELAHVRRRDGLAQVLALLACALYWPNPLVWAAARALRREAELAADDAVIASGVLPSAYASQLLELAAEWRERRLTPTGLAMAAPPALSQRVQSILATDAIRTGATAMDTLKLVVLGGAATAALTLARPSVAEVAPSSPAVPPAAPSADLQPAAPPQLQPEPAPTPAPAPKARPSRRLDRNVELAQQGDPAPSVPPAPPAVAAAPLPPLAPAAPQPGAPPAPPRAGGAWTMTWLAAPPGSHPLAEGRIVTNAMTPEQQAELERKLAGIGPAIDKAIADAHIDETVQKALSAQDAKTREEVANQLQQIGPRIQQAIANAHIQELVGQRLAQLQPQLNEARKVAQERRAQAEERVAAQLEAEAKRARERAQRDREQLKQFQAPQPAQRPEN